MIIAPPTKRIVYTRDEDGGVSVHCPNGAAFFWMQRGGLWKNKPRGYLSEQIRRQVAGNIPEKAAHMWVMALQYGGVTEAEAWEIIRDHNCATPSGHSHELMEFSELPDRWFRDAWVRGHNGGPPRVDLEKARPIQFKKIKAAVKMEMLRRETELYEYKKPVNVAWGTVERAIKHARDPEELRKVWPEKLGKS